MAAVVTYDVDSKHVEVKNAMKAKGYSDTWNYNAQTYNLPSTTLYKQDVNATTALADIKARRGRAAGQAAACARTRPGYLGRYSGRPALDVATLDASRS